MKTTCKTRQHGMTLIELSVVLLILVALAGVTIPYVAGTGQRAACQATDATLQAVKQAIMGGTAGVGFYADILGHYPAVTGGQDYALHSLFSPRDVEAAADAWPPFNPSTGVGWRGPYLTQGGLLDTVTLGGLNAGFSAVFNTSTPAVDAYVHINLRSYDGADADTVATDAEAAQLQHVLDAWHRPVVLQIPYFGGAYQPDYARLVSAGPGSGLNPGDAALDTTIQNQTASNRGDDRVLYLKIPDPLPGGNAPCQ